MAISTEMGKKSDCRRHVRPLNTTRAEQGESPGSTDAEDGCKRHFSYFRMSASRFDAQVRRITLLKMPA